MALINKPNKNQSIAELESYYAKQSNKSGSTARAWIMAILAVLLTILVLSMVFFAGRWIYNRFAHKTSSNISMTQDEYKTDDSNKADEAQEQGKVDDGAASTDQSNSSSNSDSSSTNDSSSNSSSNGTVIAGGDTATTPSGVANTGPGETAMIVALVSGLAGYAANLYRSKKANR